MHPIKLTVKKFKMQFWYAILDKNGSKKVSRKNPFCLHYTLYKGTISRWPPELTISSNGFLCQCPIESFILAYLSQTAWSRQTSWIHPGSPPEHWRASNDLSFLFSLGNSGQLFSLIRCASSVQTKKRKEKKKNIQDKFTMIARRDARKD